MDVDKLIKERLLRKNKRNLEEKWYLMKTGNLKIENFDDY